MSFATEERTEKLKAVLEKRQFDITTVFENIDDPHNVMACLRTCDAIGIYEANIIRNQPIRKKKAKVGHASSSSAKKWVEQVLHTNVEDCYNKLRSEGKKIFTTHLSSDSVSIYDIDFTQPIALVFGNEHNGVSQEAVAKADGNFIIPQVGMISSLNISVACAVTLYEAYRQKLKAGHYSQTTLTESIFESLIREWSLK
jgi:tRNA (guanosine-2'-O-)-methyltransferase